MRKVVVYNIDSLTSGWLALQFFCSMLLFLILYQVGSEIFSGIHHLYIGNSATKIRVTLNVIWFICDMLFIYQIFVYSTIFNSAALRRLRMVFRMFFCIFYFVVLIKFRLD
jgi:hypothetical protein